MIEDLLIVATLAYLFVCLLWVSDAVAGWLLRKAGYSDE